MKTKNVSLLFSMTVVLCCEMPLSSDDENSLQAGEIVIENFDLIEPLDWRIVNDNVMGGVSNSSMYFRDDETAIFYGDVSLKNNGGFASIRAYYGPSLEGINTISIRVKGDGQKYNFRVRTAEVSWASYTVSFQTIPNKWLEFDFNLVDFLPTYRGYRLNQMPSLSDLTIRSIGFMISDKQEGEFNLSLDWVKAN